MTHTASHRHPQRAFTAVLLVLSLLLAQWLGLTHAIAHSGVASAQITSTPDWEPIEHTQSATHCAALDAATHDTITPLKSNPVAAAHSRA